MQLSCEIHVGVTLNATLRAHEQHGIPQELTMKDLPRRPCHRRSGSALRSAESRAAREVTSSQLCTPMLSPSSARPWKSFGLALRKMFWQPSA